MDTLKCEKAAVGTANERALRDTSADTLNTCAHKTTPVEIKPLAKRLIVSLAVWGFVPASFTSWLLRMLGLVAE